MTNSETVRIKYSGHGEVTDNVVGYTWTGGDTNELSETDARQLLTNGRFSRVETETNICGVEKHDGSTCERPVNECPYHQGTGLDYSDNDDGNNSQG